MEQLFLEENLWRGGVWLDDVLLKKIIQPSFEWISCWNPDKLYLPMKVKEGRDCRVCVSVGEYVEKYGIVGIREGEKIQDHHVVRSDLPGYVAAIGRKQTGYRTYEEYVELEVCAGKEKKRLEYYPCSEKIDDLREMQEALAGSGIPGINGILFDGSRRRQCEIIILNAAVDDPSVLYDLLMIRERPGQLLYGLLIFLQLLGGEKILIIACRRQQSAVENLTKAAEKYFTGEIMDRISVIFVQDTYPGGKDELLVRNLAKWVKDRNWVILHVDQVLGAYDMVYDHKPWTRRRFLMGGCMPVNGCYEFPIGTSLKEVLKGLNENWLQHAGILVDGGLMAGYTVDPEHSIIHSGMRSLLILPRIEENEQSCQTCGGCSDVCPAGLVPWDLRHRKDRDLCMGCGCCSYICPSRRRLKEYVQRGGRPQAGGGRGNYIELTGEIRHLPPAMMTGYSSPYIRRASSPFTCILSPFQL